MGHIPRLRLSEKAPRKVYSNGEEEKLVGCQFSYCGLCSRFYLFWISDLDTKKSFLLLSCIVSFPSCHLWYFAWDIASLMCLKKWSSFPTQRKRCSDPLELDGTLIRIVDYRCLHCIHICRFLDRKSTQRLLEVYGHTIPLSGHSLRFSCITFSPTPSKFSSVTQRKAAVEAFSVPSFPFWNIFVSKNAWISKRFICNCR